MTLEERFWPKVNKTSKCWLWSGYVDPSTGHGRFNQGTVGRVVWAFTYGEIPKGKFVHRSCGNLLCVRPNHLKLGKIGRPFATKGEFIERFLSRVDKNGPIHPILGTRCWLWKRTHTGRGYGSFAYTNGGRMGYAHRFAWEMIHGPIPGKLYVLHHCDNVGCCNPDHLFVGTQLDNIRDCIAKGRFKPIQRCNSSTESEGRHNTSPPIR